MSRSCDSFGEIWIVGHSLETVSFSWRLESGDGMRGLFRWAVAPALVTFGVIVVMSAPVQASSVHASAGRVEAPAGVCPKAPANFAGKHVQVGPGDDEALLCANLKGATLDGLNLGQFDLKYADLTNASLLHTSLGQADLTGAKLAGAKFDGADLTQATLDNVTAAGASFQNAKLIQATIHSATLTNANFTDADMTQVDLTGSDISGATLTGASMDEATTTGLKETGTHGSPKTTFGTSGISSSSFHLIVLIIPAVIIVFVLIVIMLVTRAVRRSVRRTFTYANSYPMGQAGQPGQPASPFPAMVNQFLANAANQQAGGYPPGQTAPVPGFPGLGVPPTVPTQATPGLFSPTQAPPVPAPTSTSTPYIPTVPDVPAWQPASTASSMADASHVIEEEGDKKWFRKK
jgi:Pentapeptide repeats (8 copies)